MTRTTMTFWSGLKTIGGNIVELCYGNDRIIFDFGLVYDPKSSLLNKSTRSPGNYVADMLKLGMIPAIDGIYSEEDIQYIENLQPLNPTDYGNTAVFISHIHLDHIGAIDTIAPAIPVYMSNDSKKLYQAFCKTDQPFYRKREVTGLNYQEVIQIGQIKVMAFQTDHDVFGAMALLIETPDLTILYSGDIRMHGNHVEYNETMLDYMEKIDINILLIEGTSFQPSESKTEASLQNEKAIRKQVADMIIDKDELALFNIYHTNLDRVQQFIDAANDAGRKVVFEVETAYIVDQLLEIDNLSIFYNERMNYDKEWKQTLMKKYPLITNTTLNENPGEFLVQSSFHYIMNLLDLRVKDAIYLHSNGMPLGSFDPNYDRLLALLSHLEIQYQSLNVSGHATEKDILDIIARVNPNLVIPWHSHYPELVIPKDKNQPVFFPKAKKTYYFHDNELKEYS
ncbi:MBL fold metallo-hydrolase [Gracilibacillus xinjiangensis]|uniref:MBL fold metallo-hydrolase n=1 Tax=Gracilibacillus xinjiangensis TaxID=1193282 RepID=A0ABV8WRP9_9BACI